MTSLEQELLSIHPGTPAHFRNLTIIPLFRRTPAQASPAYRLLDEALAHGLVRITEIGGGVVPELQLENHGDLPVLLLDGEELLGAKQNRVLNLTVLAPAAKTITIPVSCVEHGRWHDVSPEFRPSPNVMFGAARSARTRQVTESMRQTGMRRSDQGAVWNDIAACASALDAPSETGAMSAVFERQAITLEEFCRAFSYQEGQCGVVFGIGGRPSGFDLFDHPHTMSRLFPKLLRSYALDALAARGRKSDPVAPEAAAVLLRSAATAPASIHEAVGCGKDVRFAGSGVSGAGLWSEVWIHLCGFSTSGNGTDSPLETRIARPSRRRI